MSNRYDYTVFIGGVDATAVFNKMGGPANAQRYLANELILTEVPKPKPVPELLTEFSVNLDGPARLPFPSAVLEVHRGSGVVKVERKLDGTYIDKKKPGLFLSEKQRGGGYPGHNLRKEVEARNNNLSAVLLDFFVEHPEFWPDEWKKDSQGNTLCVLFWDDIFRSPSIDRLFVRYGCWDGGRVVSNYDWLDGILDGSYPAASAS